MRFANTSRILLLALSAFLVTSVVAQDDHPNIQPHAVRDQLKTNAPGQSQPQTAPPSPAPPTPQPAAPASAGTKPKPKAKPAAAPKSATATKEATAGKAPAAAAAAAKTPPKKAAANPAKPPVEKPVEAKFVKRDPFDTLLNKARAGGDAPANLPPGKAGLIVSTLRIDGIVRGPAAMIAIVSNPQQRVYFLHEGDKLYDGSVEKITLDAVLFHEIGKDAFGKPLEREVTRRLYPSPGEQQ